MDKEIRNLIIVGIIITIIVVSIGMVVEVYRWGVYKRITHSDISFFDFFVLGDKIRIVQ